MPSEATSLADLLKDTAAVETNETEEQRQEREDNETYGTEDDRRYNSDAALIPVSEWRSYIWDDHEECWIARAEARFCADSSSPMSTYWRDNNCYYHADSDTWYVDEDNLPRDDDSTRMLDYSADVLRHIPGIFDRNSSELVFGLELEMEARDDIDSVLSELSAPVFDRYIVKSDGSLNNGCELVSLPMTLEAHREYNWGLILTNALRRTAKSANTSTCGFHVHINRKALKPLTVGKMLVMTNTSDPAMSELLTLIAQRAPGHWCQKYKKTLRDGRAFDSAHHDILGLTRKGTCELRMFKGNLLPARIYKNLEFCHAMVRFCEKTSGKYVENVGVFCAWLAKHKANYPELCKYLSDRQYAPWLALHSGNQSVTITTTDNEEA